MRILLTGVAAIALAGGGAFAQGQGNGQDKGGEKRDGGGVAATMQSAQSDPGKSSNPSSDPATIVRGQAAAATRGANGKSNGSKDRSPSDDGDAAAVRSERGETEQALQGLRRVEREVQRTGTRAITSRSGDASPQPRRLRAERILYDPRLGFGDGRYAAAALIEGCPPGLARKDNGCQPPGQARKNQPSLFQYAPSLFGLKRDKNGRYLYDNGYLVQIGSSGGIAKYLPLLGGALAIGNTWPTSYPSYALPDYYVDYYNLGMRDGYRFADNVIYQVDPETTAIESIAALLTGDRFAVGQPLPNGYDVYNVPSPYRDRYYDTPDASYRYSDGYVYRVDPETQLIAAAIDLLI